MTLLFSCTNKRPFEKFDLSYSAEHADYSIEFTQSDTVFLRYNFSYLDIYDSIDAPKSKTSYYAILEKKDCNEFDNMLREVDFEKYDTAYYQDFVDGLEYKIYIKRRNLEKTIYIRSLHAPRELDALARWIDILVENLKLNKIDRELNFKSKLNSLPFIPPPKVISDDSL